MPFMIEFFRTILKSIIALAILIAVLMFLELQGFISLQPIHDLISKVDQKQTLYQWTDSSGAIQITAEPPAAGIQFHEFVGSADLLRYQQQKGDAFNKPNSSSEPQIREVSNYKQQQMEAFIAFEVSTQCRWIIQELYTVDSEAEQNQANEAICKRYQSKVADFARADCRNALEEFKLTACQ